MTTVVVAWVLGIATVLGGIAAVLYFRDKWLERNHWTEQDKPVNSAWWEESDLKKAYQAKGYTTFRWSDSDRVAERLSGGMKIVYEIDEANKIKYRLVNSSGQVLLCRKI